MAVTSFTRHGILAAGNLIVDHVKLIDTWPSQDALVSILEQESSNGGGPYNVAKDLAKLFADREDGVPFPLAVAGMIGDDANGAWIRSDLEAHGILDPTLLTTAPDQSTSYTDVMTVAATGRRTFFHQRGANAVFQELPIPFAQLPHRVFYLGYLLLLDSLDELDPEGETGASRLLREAREAGLKTVVDLVSEESDRFQRVISPSLPHTDVLLTNEFEAGRLSGIDLSDFQRKSAAAAARAIRELGVNRYVVIHAPSGSLALDCRTDREFVSGSVALPDSEIRGAVGAGDAFAAGFLLGFYEELDLTRSLQQAACVAASCLGHPTTSGGILPLPECLALGEHWGFREF